MFHFLSLSETMLLDGYDHIMDISGEKKHTSARELAELKELKEMLILFDKFKKYKVGTKITLFDGSR